METRFVGTPWRGRRELLALRGLLFGGEVEGRQEAVNTILAWKVRKLELPLLLESTADLVDAVLQDERGELQLNALRMVYATAVSRFITGLADTQAELSRDRPTWFLPTQSLQLPLALRETRHCIVHRHLPSLAELKRAAKESLDWLWEWYWSHLDAAFSDTRGGDSGRAVLTEREARERLQGILKSYVKERKAEVKRRAKADTKAAESAVASYLFFDVAQSLKQKLLLDLLVDEKAILPTDKRLGSNMSGAFLIWTPFLLALCKAMPTHLHLLLERMVDNLSSPVPGMLSVESDPGREGLYEWCTHILASGEWKEIRQRTQTPNTSNSGTGADARLLEHVLALCFTTPTLWNLKLAHTILRKEDVAGRESWLAILEAARSEDVDMDIEGATMSGEAAMEVDNTTPAVAMAQGLGKAMVPRMRGPQKRVGLWKPLPIGTLVEG